MSDAASPNNQLGTIGAENQSSLPWLYNNFQNSNSDNTFNNMAGTAFSANFNYSQQYANAYYNHMHQYANSQQQKQPQPPLPNTPPGFGKPINDAPPLPPHPPSISSSSPGNLIARPPFFNPFAVKQPIRFNLNKSKLQHNNPLNLNSSPIQQPQQPQPQQDQQQQQHLQQNLSNNSKKKRKRNKNKANQLNNNSANNSSPNSMPNFLDMSIPPPTLITNPITTPDLTKPPPLYPSTHFIGLPAQSPENSMPQQPQQPQPTSQKPDTFNQSGDVFPESLTNYVARCYAKCKTDFDKDQIDICLKGRITAAANRGELWTKDWDSEPIPSVHSERNNILVPKAPVVGMLAQYQKKKGLSQTLGARLGNRSAKMNRDLSHDLSRSKSRSPLSRERKRSSRSRSSDSDSPPRKSNRRSSNSSSDENYKSIRSKSNKFNDRMMGSTGLNNKKQKKKKNKKGQFIVGGDVDGYGDSERLQQRAARFNNSAKRPNSVVAAANMGKRKKFQPVPQHRIFVDDADTGFDLIDFHVVGTCRDMEKSFLRLTKAPLPSEIRPAEVLVFSLANVMKRWKEKPDYFYACDQLKSIRQDLTVSSKSNCLSVAGFY